LSARGQPLKSSNHNEISPLFQDDSEFLDIDKDLKISSRIQSRSRSPILGSKNLTDSHKPIEVYYSKKKSAPKPEELNMKDFVLFSEDAEATFSPNKKKKHCFYMDKEDIVPVGSDEKQKSSNFNGLSSLSKIDL
jgi:hypothetical protein